MKPTIPIIAAGAGLLLCACIPSVQPFFTGKDVVFDPALLGEWRAKDKEEEPQVWKFGRGKDKAYALTVTDNDGKKGHFSATLFNLKEHRFLDLIAEDCEFATNQVDLVGVSMIPGHLLVHVAQIEPDLKMAFFDFDWLEHYLKENPKALAHRGGDGIVLTATTPQLQRFVLKHVDGGELFSDYGELEKKSAP